MNFLDILHGQDLGGGYDPSLPGICGFQKEYQFLSNFWSCPVELWGIKFLSSEQAYVYSKSEDEHFRRQVLAEVRPGKIKQLGSLVELRPNWDDIKRDIMKEILFAKFRQNPELKRKLLETGMRYLEETNWWHDTYWGVCNGIGDNNLGQLLMLVRTTLRKFG